MSGALAARWRQRALAGSDTRHPRGVLTDDAFDHMIRMAERYESGVNDVIAAHRVPWNSIRLGCRVEYHFQATPPRNGSEAIACGRPPCSAATCTCMRSTAGSC